jgi:hypothetical protein
LTQAPCDEQRLRVPGAWGGLVITSDGGVHLSDLRVHFGRNTQIEAAKRWYNSPAYQERKRGRLGAAEFELILVEGGVVPADQRLPQIKT